MLEKNSVLDQRIIEYLNNYYGIDVVKLTFLPLGADMNASVYKAEAINSLSYFVKLKCNVNHDISIAIVELLHDTGVQQVIYPIKTISGQLIQKIEDFNLIVYPFIDAQNGFDHTLTDKQWVMLGQALKQIHAIDVPVTIQQQLRRETYSPKWREIVRSIYKHLPIQPIGDKIAKELLVFMKQNRIMICRLVDHAEKLAQKLEHDSSQFVLCHSDIHGGNVLLNGDNTLYIVDWDEPMLAPKERDLMFIGGGVGNVWNKSHEEEMFYQGYGKTDINIAMLAYYRHERIVQDIAEYAQKLILTTTGGADRLTMFQHFMDMFASNGVVEIAFKTAER